MDENVRDDTVRLHNNAYLVEETIVVVKNHPKNVIDMCSTTEQINLSSY